ncbi:MAG: MaoC family dehydratase N-terminal domain-containing protein [Firmicutes bacterium]|nr:MaoC family dehydratase N-terminal domain-containing protein [Bacillota bacterium]
MAKLNQVTKDDIGKKSPEVVHEVEKGAIRKFADAIGDPNPLFHDESFAQAHGYKSIIAPPTFAITLGAEMPIKIDPRGVLHGEQAFLYDRPIVAGDVIRCQAEVTDVYERSGHSGHMTFFVTETTGRDAQTEERIFRARGTIVIRDVEIPG